MHFQHFLRNKKAQETGGGDTTTLSLANMLSFALTGVVLVVFFFIFLGSSKSFASSGEIEQSGAETLDQFQIAFESVSNGSTDVAVTIASISEDQVLAVFGADEDETLRDTCGWNNDMKKNLDFCRPSDDFCVCLYDEEYTAYDPLECRSMPSGNYFNVYTEPYEYFTANFGEVDEKNNRADTVIYSDCWSSGTKLKAKKLTIQKDGDWIRISDNTCGNSGMGECMHICKGKKPIERKSLSHTCIEKDRSMCCTAEEP